MFIWTACQQGSEKYLKNEIARIVPGAKPAFMRPGFVTFKVQRELRPDFILNSVFARNYGISGPTIAADSHKAEVYLSEVISPILRGKPIKFQAFERNEEANSEELQKFLAALPLLSGDLKLGDFVLDVVRIDPGRIFLGHHIQTANHSNFPGGIAPFVLPEGVPSRAWLKLEEALALSYLPLNAGDRVLEVGCAPGGMTWGLLDRGLEVWGVDAAEMSPIVLEKAKKGQFFQISESIITLPTDRIPEGVDWFICDLNGPPPVTLAALERIFNRTKKSLKGIILTLKLNDEGYIADIPKYLAKIQSMGFKPRLAKQIFSNRQEFTVVSHTRVCE